MIVRIGFGFVVAVGVTFGLLFLMQALIATGGNLEQEEKVRRILDFVRVKPNEVTNEEEIKPDKPPPPEAPPPDMPQPNLDPINPNANVIGVAAPSFNNTVDIGLGGSFVGDGEYLPIVKVAPIYPRRALTRGLEGYVLVEFTVTTAGTVRDPVVIEADPPNIFDRAAVQAALRFKYKPRVIDGEPVEVPGVRNLIRFELQE